MLGHRSTRNGHVTSRATIAASIAVASLMALGGAVPASAAAPSRHGHAGSASPALFGTEAWAWAVNRHPGVADHTPASVDRGNSTGGSVQIHRNGKGNWDVTFKDVPTLDTPLLHVSPLGPQPDVCILDDWASIDDDFMARIDCHDRFGTHTDTGFVVSLVLQFNLSDDLGYVFADEPQTADYFPSAQYNSADQANSVHKLPGVGRWEVTLPGLGAADGRGTVLVSAAGLPRTVCRVRGWTSGIVATVVCRDHMGALIDNTYHLSYAFKRGLKFEGSHNVVTLLADRPTTSSYHPARGYRYSSAGILPVVSRTGVGSYQVTLPGMPKGGSAQVSAYGSGSGHCVVSSIRTSKTPQRIGVRCFNASGSAAADTPFTLAYAR